MPLFNQSDSSAGSGLVPGAGPELVQTSCEPFKDQFALPRTWEQSGSHHSVTTYIELIWPTTSTLYKCCSWICVPSVGIQTWLVMLKVLASVHTLSENSLSLSLSLSALHRSSPRYPHAAGGRSLHRRGAGVRLRTERLARVWLKLKLLLHIQYTQTHTA